MNPSFKDYFFLNEGLDLHISDHRGHYWTKEILGVTSELSRILNPKFGVMYGDITPDDNNYNQREGNINIYRAEGQDDTSHGDTAKAAWQWLRDNGFNIGEVKLDTSQFREGEPVWRIYINEMPPDDNEPGVHMTYGNAADVFEFIGYGPGEISNIEHFSLDANDLLYRIETVEGDTNRMKQHERPNEQEGNFYSMGQDYTDIQRKVGYIKELAQWAIDNGYPTVNAS